jgi:hypothetical protein
VENIVREFEVKDLIVDQYSIWPYEPGRRIPPTIERREGTEGQKWAVCMDNMCLTKALKWEYERSPSNRTGAFLKKTRFDSPQEALSIFNKWLIKHGEEVFPEIVDSTMQ